MPTLLYNEAPELTDLSLLLLADLAAAKTGKRWNDRVANLFSDMHFVRGTCVPGHVAALEQAGLATTRRRIAQGGGEGTWCVEITDTGRALHRCLMAALRNAAPLLKTAR